MKQSPDARRKQTSQASSPAEPEGFRIHGPHMSTSGSAEADQRKNMIPRALKSIIRELKLSSLHQWGEDYDPNYLSDIDTTSLESFKDTFTYGSGWNWGAREEFIDLFGCGNTYDFKFTEFECIILNNDFEVIIQPSISG